MKDEMATNKSHMSWILTGTWSTEIQTGTYDPVKKKSLKLKMLWLLCNHTVNPKTDSKTLYYSVLKLKYSHCPSILHCKAQQRRKRCVLLSNSHNNCHRNYTNRILLTHMFRSINVLIFASYGMHAMNYLVSLGTTMRQGPRRLR